MSLKQTMHVKSRLIVWAACLVLVFGAGLASAECKLNFCDADGDTYFRDHKKCKDCPGPYDCDDSNDGVGPCEGTLAYTAELTAGAFVFRDGTGQPAALNVFPFEEGDRLLSAEMAIMFRPGGGALQETWDNAFLDVCPGLGVDVEPPNEIVVPEIRAYPEDWSISGYGGVARISLTDYVVQLVDDDVSTGENWELWIQLIGEEEPPDPFLPTVAGDESVFLLPTLSLWGKPASKKGRKSDCIGGPLPNMPLRTEESVLTIRACLPTGTAV